MEFSLQCRNQFKWQYSEERGEGEQGHGPQEKEGHIKEKTN